MRQFSRFQLRLIAACLSIGWALNANGSSDSGLDQDSFEPASAIEPANSNAVHTNHRDSKLALQSVQPGASVTATEKRPPELERIVNDWKAKSANITSVSGAFRKSEFNHVFQTENVTTGRFFVETPHRWRIDESPVELKKNAVSQKVGKDRELYKLVTSDPRRLICTRDEFVFLHEKEKSFSRCEFPQDRRRTDKLRCPLPFRLLMNVDDFERKFELSLIRETDEAAFLVGINRREPKPTTNFLISDFFDWFDFSGDSTRKVTICLDKNFDRPTKVRSDCHSGLDVVYTFDEVHFNDAAKQNSRDVFGEDVFGDLALKGYKDLTPAPASQHRSFVASRERMCP